MDNVQLSNANQNFLVRSEKNNSTITEKKEPDVSDEKKAKYLALGLSALAVASIATVTIVKKVRGKNNSSSAEQKAVQNTVTELKNNVRQFFDEASNEVTGVTFNKKGQALTSDNQLFSGCLKYTNSKNEQVLIKYRDGVKDSCQIGDVFKFFSYDTIDGVSRISVRTTGNGTSSIKDIYKNSNGKVFKIFSGDEFTEYRNGRIFAKGKYYPSDATSIQELNIFDENGNVISKILPNINNNNTRFKIDTDDGCKYIYRRVECPRHGKVDSDIVYGPTSQAYFYKKDCTEPYQSIITDFDSITMEDPTGTTYFSFIDIDDAPEKSIVKLLFEPEDGKKPVGLIINGIDESIQTSADDLSTDDFEFLNDKIANLVEIAKANGFDIFNRFDGL